MSTDPDAAVADEVERGGDPASADPQDAPRAQTAGSSTVDQAPTVEGPAEVRVTLPAHLRTLARVHGEVTVEAPQPVTLGGVVDALEARWPALGGTIRDRATGTRRAFVRFYVGGEDLSHEPMDAPLPAAVARGQVPVTVIGAMAGG